MDYTQSNNTCYNNSNTSHVNYTNCTNQCNSSINTGVCPPEPRGPKNPKNPKSPKDPTGITVTFTANYAYITNNTLFITPASYQPIPLDTNVKIQGKDISHTPPSTDIILAPNHCYLVEWSAIVIPNTINPYYVYLTLDGNAIPGSAANDTSVATLTVKSIRGRSSIICTSANSAILRLGALYTNTTFPAPQNPPNDSNVSITIVELS